MGRPRHGAARDTRRLILDAAVDLLAARGAHGTSMRVLAAAVGLRESALYYHFSSKADLLRAALAPPDEADPRSDPAASGATAPRPGAGAAGAAPGGSRAAPVGIDRPLEEIFLAFARQLAASLGTPRRRKQLSALLTTGGAPAGDAWGLIADLPRRRLARLLARLRRAGRVREDAPDLDVIFLHVLAPLLFATGVLAPGGRPAIAIPLLRFLQGHAALLAQSLAPPTTRSRRALPR